MLRLWTIFSLLVLSSFGAFSNNAPSTESDVLDFAPDVSDSIILSRIAQIETDIPVSFNPKVRRFIDYFTLENRDYTRKMLYRYKEYFPMFEEKLAENDMPLALKYLTIVESGINPTIKSHAGALGLWQFMPYTGKMYKLDYDYYIDERMDPEKSTEAACAFLKDLYRMFDDWELALAAYNCGPGNVRKAIRRSGYKKTFWEIYAYLPRETRSYVPQFMAMIYTMNFAEEHNLYSAKTDYVPEHETVKVSQYVNIELLAKELQICEEELLEINPEIKRKTVSEIHQNYELKIPSSRLELFNANRVAILDSVGKKGKERLKAEENHVRVVYKVRRGDVLGKIADRYRVRLTDLRMWNNISRRNIIHVGQKLEIYTKAKYAYNHNVNTSSTRQVASVSPTKAPKYYTVRNGDTLWDISRRFQGLSVQKIKQLNNLSGSSLKVGQKLRLS